MFGYMGFLKAPVVTLMSKDLCAALHMCRQEVIDMLGKSAVSSQRAVQK